MHKVTSQQAALILLYALKERGERRGKGLTRARLSLVTLKRLWNRETLSEAWLAEVNDWLLSAGWTLVQAGTTFGIVKQSVVQNWPRVAASRIQDMLDEVVSGRFDFDELEPLLQPIEPSATTSTDQTDGKRKRATKSRRHA